TRIANGGEHLGRKLVALCKHRPRTKRVENLQPLGELRLPSFRVDRIRSVFRELKMHSDAVLVREIPNGLERVVVERHECVRTDEPAMRSLAATHPPQETPILFDRRIA